MLNTLSEPLDVPKAHDNNSNIVIARTTRNDSAIAMQPSFPLCCNEEEDVPPIDEQNTVVIMLINN